MQPIIINVDDIINAFKNVGNWIQDFYSQFIITLAGHDYNFFSVLVTFLLISLVVSTLSRGSN